MSLLFLMCFSSTFQAQGGVDVIVWMDNSGSIDATEYAAMATTTRNIIDATIACNPSKNRVAVVEYGRAHLSNGSRPNRLFIESDFTNNAATAKNFQRRGSGADPSPANDVGFHDEAHSALGFIGDALDGINNTGIVSTQKTLTRTPGNRLVVFFFTDAERDFFPYSSLINPGLGDVFLNYNNFKANRGVHFIVLKGGPNEQANRAAAAIASVGGSFTDATNIDANPSDPQGSKTTPRAYYYTTNFTISPVDLNALVGEICSANSCSAGTTAPSIQNLTNICPATYVDLTTAHTGTIPVGSSLVWFNNNTHTGTALSGTQITQAGAGTYYAFYFDSINNCYSPASSAVIATINPCFVCPPDPYAAQQTWWIPYNNSKVRIDFQTGAAVLNNPATGFLGQGNFDGFEGNATVTHPITGELLFVTDGNVIYKGATGVKAIGAAVGGNSSAGEAAGVTPDPQGVLGRDFIIFGNSAGNTPGTLRRAKYNLETNTVSGVTTLLPFNTIYEALEIIPHANGTDYWILLNTTDQKVKSYLYSKATGFNSTPVSSTDVNNLPGVDASTIAIHSFIAWDPRTPGKVLISRHNKVGLANFNPSTGVLGSWDVKVTVTSGTTQENSYTGYSAALSPNGRYIYYNEYYQPNNTGTLKYYDIQTGLTTALDVSVFGMNGMKIAPDGKLYKLGYISGVLRLLYLNTDANTPPSSPGSLLPFDTDGREIGLQFPNNVYWGCITCQSGTVAPTLANTNITSNPATVGDLIALLSASNQPAGTAITIHSGSTATDANKLANSTAIVAGTTYYASFYDGLALCYSPTTAVTVGASYCYKPAVLDLGNIYNSKHGITSLGRAGTENENWPMVRQSAWSVLESKTKGLVVNRVRFNTSNQPVADDGTTLVITNPVEGMMVYDKTNNCLKMYTSNNGGSTFQWHCMTTQACPN